MIVLVPSLDQCPLSSRLAPPWSVIYVLLSHMLVDITFIYLFNNQQSLPTFHYYLLSPPSTTGILNDMIASIKVVHKY